MTTSQPAYVVIGGKPACEFTRLMNEGETCGHLSKASAMKLVRRLRAEGFQDVRAISGHCPNSPEQRRKR